MGTLWRHEGQLVTGSSDWVVRPGVVPLPHKNPVWASANRPQTWWSVRSSVLACARGWAGPADRALLSAGVEWRWSRSDSRGCSPAPPQRPRQPPQDHRLSRRAPVTEYPPCREWAPHAAVKVSHVTATDSRRHQSPEGRRWLNGTCMLPKGPLNRQKSPVTLPKGPNNVKGPLTPFGRTFRRPKGFVREGHTGLCALPLCEPLSVRLLASGAAPSAALSRFVGRSWNAQKKRQIPFDSWWCADSKNVIFIKIGRWPFSKIALLCLTRYLFL